MCKDYIQNPSTWSCKNGEYLASITDDSAIKCDEIIDSYNEKQKPFQQILMKRQQSVKCRISIFYLYFY